MKKIAIIGGGITGLSAGWELKKKQIPFKIFEASDSCGGAIKTIHEENCIIEAGPNSLSSPNTELDRLINELDLKDEICFANEQASNRFIVKNGIPLAIPRSIVEFIKTPLFTNIGKWRLLKEPFIYSKSYKDESLAEFVERRLGLDFLNYAVDPFVRGIYAGDPKKLIVSAAFPSLVKMEKNNNSLFNAIIKKKIRNPKTTQPKKQTIYTFISGMDTLPNRLVDKIGSDSIITNHKVTNINVNSSSEWIIDDEFFSDVIITIPSHKQLQIATPFDLNFLENIHYPAVSSLSLLFDSDQFSHPLDGFGMLIPSCENHFILGVLFPSAIFPNRAPTNKTLLTIFIGGENNPERALLPIEEILPHVKKDLEKLLGLKGDPIHTSLNIWTHAIPQYDSKITQTHQYLSNLESTQPGLYFAGNYRDGISITNSIKSGCSIVKKLLEQKNIRKEFD